MEGTSLARLANPTLKNLIEIEIDLNIVVGTLSQAQFEACYEPLDKNKAFFHYIIKSNLADDINICFNLPQETEEKLVANIAYTPNNPVQCKKCFSGLALKELFLHNQPTTGIPLNTISVRGVQGIYSETLSKAIEGCSASFRFGTETLSKEGLRVNLHKLLILVREQISNLNNKFDEFNEVDCRSIKVLRKCMTEQSRLTKMLMNVKDGEDQNVKTRNLNSKINKDMNYKETIFAKNKQFEEIVLYDQNFFSTEKECILDFKHHLKLQQSRIAAVVEKWVRSLTTLRELNNELHKLCLDIKAILRHNFDSPLNKTFIFPDYYFKIYFDYAISAWSKDKSNLDETLNLAHSICYATKNLGCNNLTVVKKRFIEFIQPELNIAINLMEESLSSSVKNAVSTEIHIDNVPCFYAPFWPNAASTWVERKRLWPNLDVVRSIQKAGFHIVPKNSPEGDDQLEWRLSFSAAETVIALHRSEKQNYIYFLFKSIFYRFVKTYNKEKSLPSYLCKTVMLWVCEQQPQTWWEAKLPEDCVLYLIKVLHTSIKQKHLKHYFIEGLNLLEHYSLSILTNAESALIILEKQVYKTLKSMLASMRKKIEVLQAHLIVKPSYPFDLSVAFIYKQHSLSKLNLVLVEYVELFLYSYFHESCCLYEEISRTKAEIIIIAQIIDLYTKFLLLQENEELKQQCLAQEKKLGNLMLQITALDKAISTFFFGLKSLILLSCAKCDICGQIIKCESKRYSCSMCKAVGGFDVCLQCINHKENIFQLHAEQLDGSNVSVEFPTQTKNHQHIVNPPCFKTGMSFKSKESSEVKITYLFPELFCHLEKIILIIPEFDIDKFNQIYPSCNYESKLGLAFSELKQVYKDRNDIVKQNMTAHSSVDEVKPVPVIEDISRRWVEILQNESQYVTSRNLLPVINKCDLGNGIHQLYLKECCSPRCFSKFNDPPFDISYWQSILEFKKSCSRNLINNRWVTLKYKTVFDLELPGEIMKMTGFLRNLIYFGEDSCVTESAHTDKTDFANKLENSFDVLADVTEKLNNLFSGSIEMLRLDEKIILKTSHLIQLFKQIE